MDSLTAIERLYATPLPERTDSYTPISHRVIDEKSRETLKSLGFTMSKSFYRSSGDGLVGQAEYHINYGNDPEMGLMVAWQNSYNKAVSFKYAVGAHVFVCANGCVAGDLGAYRRKHTGTADVEAFEQMRVYLYGAKQIFDKLVADKEHLKKINITPTKTAELMGRMFIEKEIITSTQINIMKRELDKPTYDYGVPIHNAWSLYNFATHAFREDTPKNWMKRHIDLHDFFSEEFGIFTEKFVPTVEQPQLFEGPKDNPDTSLDPLDTPFIPAEDPNPVVVDADTDEVIPSDELIDLLDQF
jgi:hypothetical protein